MAPTPPMIGTLDEMTGRYRAILSDVWGVVHNGERAFPDSCAALRRARESGLAVVLITNSPRVRGEVEDQMKALGVPDGTYDAIVTSGDVTRELIRQGPRRIFHLGPDANMTLYDGLDVELVEEFEADGVVCTGPVDDDVETPEDYAEQLRRFRARDLPFICANPDIMVERGDRLIWCAGALARDYAQLGGRTLIAGKPHLPIYRSAMKLAAECLGATLTERDMLAIGDGILTDVKGAEQSGIDILYVSAGIHAREYGDPLQPDVERLGAFFEKHGQHPVAFIPRLR